MRVEDDDVCAPPAIDVAERAMPRRVKRPQRAGHATGRHGSSSAGVLAQLHQRARHATVLEQRLALAHDPHDSAMQMLFSLHLTAHAAAERVEREPAQAREAMELVLRLIREVRMEMHTALFELHENVLGDDGLVVALERYVAMLDSHYNLRIVLRLQRDVRMPARYQKVLYLLAREGIGNVIKHAQAGQATVTLTADDTGIRLRIEDDGVGFREAEPEWVSQGLRLLQERVRGLGGILRLGNGAQGGAFVEATLRLPEES